MTESVLQAGPAGYGVFPANVDVLVVHRGSSPTALAAGEVVTFCMFNSAQVTADGGTINVNPGSKESIFASVVRRLALYDRECGFAGVMLEPCADQQVAKCRIQGTVMANVKNLAGGAIVHGSHVTFPIAGATGDGYFEAASFSTAYAEGQSVKIFGYTLSSVAAPTSTGALTPIVFNGINGMGMVNS